MKVSNLLNILLAVTAINGITIDISHNSKDEIVADPTITSSPDAKLVKRIDAEYIENQRQKLKDLEAKVHGQDESASDVPRPWIRTIYGTVVERVVPTVVQGVTISAKPPKETNGLEPWISLKKDGSPQTIKPKIKNGHTQNASPTYSTWFSKPTTVIYTNEQLKAHNMKEGEVHEEIEWVEEDQTYHSLNPVIRCTPDFYFKKGLNKNVLSEPFCFPKDNSVMKSGRSYFITWFTKFFDPEVKKVKFHLSSVKRSVHDQGLKKRSAIIENGGKIQSISFWDSNWIRNEGMFTIDITDEFFDNEDQMEKTVLLSIQPDNVPDEEFDFLKNSLILKFIKPGKVYKGHNEDLKLLEEKQKYKHLQTDEIEDGIDYDKYFAILGIPSFILFLGFGMYVFVWFNKVDLSHLKSKKASGKNHGHRRIPFVSKKKHGYSSLPQHNSDIPLSTFKGD